MDSSQFIFDNLVEKWGIEQNPYHKLEIERDILKLANDYQLHVSEDGNFVEDYYAKLQLSKLLAQQNNNTWEPRLTQSIYKILSVAKNSENFEDVVIYQDLNNPSTVLTMSCKKFFKIYKPTEHV